MKVNVKCLVSGVNSTALDDAESTTKQVEIQNPNALLSSLRAKAGLAFRLNLSGFSMLYRGPRSGQVDLLDERRALSACGLQDGDTIVLVSKRVREENASETGPAVPTPAPPPAAAIGTLADTEKITQSSPSAHAGEHAAPNATVRAPSLSDTEVADEEEPELLAADEEGEDDEEAMQLNLDAVALTHLLGADADAGAAQLYSRLIEVVPNLVELREQFLSNPHAVMERIQREDPSLFQLITAHQEAFVNLINNESVLRTMQEERDRSYLDDDEELDEEALENLMGMLAGEAGDYDEESGEEGEEGEELPELGLGSDKEDKARILAFAPSEDDEKKIQELTQLGFSYDVCKLAFYLSHRSLERAANLLFESPPQL